MSDDTLPDLRARYSQRDPWSAFVAHVDGSARSTEQDYQIPRRVLAIPGLSLPHRIVVGLLWDSGDRGAASIGKPIQVWLSSDSIAKRLGLSRRSVMRALKAAGDLGYVIRLGDLMTAIRVARCYDGRWLSDHQQCLCVPGSRNPNHCCCRVLAPMDADGLLTMDFDQCDRRARIERAAAMTRDRNTESDARVVCPPTEGDVDVTQPAPRGGQTLDRSANSADAMPWHFAHQIENAPWIDE